ncbi:hypothetical protein GWK41_01505 [Persephonella atlantica]|uniref:Cytochrome c-552/4 domain-containing protein n=1 Tax=Persephonella atlantica TaxID=2699429 RepID=A0ABS1GFP2_9AQUI|nr:hypothetical protein [Persephonella atlantica]MBK3331739.1 hypothetical protein [Persephonella atlantica]
MVSRAVLLLFIVVFTFSYGKNLKLKDVPRELSNYYPPKSENMEFTQLMHLLSTSMTGVVVNLKEEDWNNAQKWAERLQKNYLKIGKMVKKWDKLLKKDEVHKLQQAIKSRNKQEAFRSVQVVGKSCVQCHKNYKLSVKVKFHSPDFSGFSLEDPVTGLDYSLKDYMKAMTQDMKLVKIYFLDGKKDKARRAGFNFIKRFEGLTQMCSDCHTNKKSEEIYFGLETKKHTTALKEAVINGSLVQLNKHLKWIGQNNCAKCHNVHETTYHLREKFGK